MKKNNQKIVDYNKNIAAIKAKDYVKWVKERFEDGTMTHADVSIVFENKSGTDVKFGEALLRSGSRK